MRELYGLPPEGFIAARDRLATELRAAGQEDEAAAVKRLRKPSVVAWAVNAASREAPEDIDALLQAGEDLRRAQRKALSKAGTDDLFTATEARKRATRVVADRAVAAIGVRGATHRDRIMATLEAASLDRELGQRLRDGTLERDAQPTTGFGAIEGFEVLQGGIEQGSGGAAQPSVEGRREQVREAKEAERAAVRAERAADQAAARAADLRKRATDTEAAAREAETDAKRLGDEAKMARKRADRAARDTVGSHPAGR